MKNSGIEVIHDVHVNNRYFCQNEQYIETGIGHSNLNIFVQNKYDPEYKKRRFELVDDRKYQLFRRFILNDLAEKLVKILRADKVDEFRRNIGFNVYDVFNNKEQSVIKSIKEVLERENMQTQYSI